MKWGDRIFGLPSNRLSGRFIVRQELVPAKNHSSGEFIIVYKTHTHQEDIMMVKSASLFGTHFKVEQPAVGSIDRLNRRPHPRVSESSRKQNKVPPNEALANIKDLTEDGLYSIRFKINKDIDKLIIQIVDKKSGELIRQIPLEELINVSEKLEDYRGLIVKTES